MSNSHSKFFCNLSLSYTTALEAVLKDLAFPLLCFSFCLSPSHFNIVYEAVYLKLPVDTGGVGLGAQLKLLEAL